MKRLLLLVAAVTLTACADNTFTGTIVTPKTGSVVGVVDSTDTTHHAP